MADKIILTIEISVAELQEALLPNGGKITNLEIEAKKTPARKTPARKTTPKKTTPKKTTPKKTTPRGESKDSKK